MSSHLNCPHSAKLWSLLVKPGASCECVPVTSIWTHKQPFHVMCMWTKADSIYVFLVFFLIPNEWSTCKYFWPCYFFLNYFIYLRNTVQDRHLSSHSLLSYNTLHVYVIYTNISLHPKDIMTFCLTETSLIFYVIIVLKATSWCLVCIGQ